MHILTVFLISELHHRLGAPHHRVSRHVLSVLCLRLEHRLKLETTDQVVEIQTEALRHGDRDGLKGNKAQTLL